MSYVNDGLKISRDKDGYFYDHMEYEEINVELPMANPKKDLAKMIDAAENLPHHYKEYLALGEVICKSIPFKDYFYCIFVFDPNNVFDYSFNRNKSSIEEQSCYTSLSNEEEEESKSEESSNPSACSSILRYFGFSSRRLSASNDHSTIQEGRTSSCLKEDAPEDLACFPLLEEENEEECTSSFLVGDLQINAKFVGLFMDEDIYFGLDQKYFYKS